MQRKDRISALLASNLISGETQPQISIEDESHQHSHGGKETHFKVLIVSEVFAGKNRVARQRMVQDVLAAEFKSGLHALSLRCLTPEEANASLDFQSPNCRGGSAQEK